jgi:hypothetical protein
MTPAHLIPVPPGVRPRQRPAEALETLAGQIRDPAGSAWSHVLGVLSLPAVSIWTNGRVLWWRAGDGEMTWPAADTEGAARRLAGHGRPRLGCRGVGGWLSESVGGRR